MKNHLRLTASFTIMLALFITSHIAKAQLFLDVESGALFPGYNDIRIPGESGTKISFKDDLQTEVSPFFRLRLGYTIKSRHTISALYAPLNVTPKGMVGFPVDFEGETFAANTPLDASYTFNSYRITYRYDLVKRPKLDFGLGFTAKIRDAEIALSGKGVEASKKNVGFVPIVNFRLHYRMNEKIGILLEGDALAAPQGRAEDVQLAGTYRFSDRLTGRIGYRLLEGGADNDEVYNFTLFHYASVGLAYTFKSN